MSDRPNNKRRARPKRGSAEGARWGQRDKRRGKVGSSEKQAHQRYGGTTSVNRDKGGKLGKKTVADSRVAAVECRGERRVVADRIPNGTTGQRFSPTEVYPPCPFPSGPALRARGTADRPLFDRQWSDGGSLQEHHQDADVPRWSQVEGGRGGCCAQSENPDLHRGTLGAVLGQGRSLWLSHRCCCLTLLYLLGR